MTLRPLILAAFLGLALALGGCAGVGPGLTHGALSFERARSDLERKEIALADGSRIVYLEGGQGEPLVLVHGFGANKDNFTRVARWLTPRYRVVVPDLTGFGESSHPEDVDYGYAAQAERLRAFVQALRLTGVHLGGNSMGGAIAMSYAAHHPDEVASLWLIDAAGIPEAPASELRRLVEAGQGNPLLVTSEDDFARMMAFALSDPPWIPRFAMDVMAQERIANQALERRIFDRIALDSVSADVRGLGTPALIVWGAEDRVIDVGTAEVLHRLLPRSQVVVMPHVGHAPMIERPRESAEEYLRFRDGLGVAGAVAGGAGRQ